MITGQRPSIYALNVLPCDPVSVTVQEVRPSDGTMRGEVHVLRFAQSGRAHASTKLQGERDLRDEDLEKRFRASSRISTRVV